MFEFVLVRETIVSSFSDIMSIVIILVTICILGFWWQKRPEKSAPGPKGLPLIGVAPKLAKNPHVTLSDWSNHYGSIMSVRVGREDWTILNTGETINEAFVKQGSKFSKRPPNYFTDCILSGRDGIMFNDGAHWKKLKRFAMSAFHRLDAGGKFFEKTINTESQCFVESMFQLEGQAVDLCPHFLGATANVVSTILSGHRVDYGTPEYEDLYNMITRFVLDPERTKLANAIIFFPALRYLPVFSDVVRQGRKDSKCLEDFLQSYMIPQKCCSDREEYDCILDILQSQNYRRDHPDLFTDRNMMYVARDLFLGGTETTTVTLLWCILSLVSDSKLQDDVQMEIDTYFRPSVRNFVDHKTSMPLTFSFMEEVHRYCTVTPLALPHMTGEDATVGGYEVKKGTTVIVNLWGAHRNPKVFKNPNEFDARRFINADGKFTKSLNVMPFSTGSRRCLGEKLGKVETFMFLGYLLKNFTIRPNDQSKLPSLNDGNLSTTYSPKPFKVVLSRRPCLR